MLDLGGFRKYWASSSNKYFIVVLFGKLKGENNYREHFIPCTNVTKSGLHVKHSIQRLIKLKEECQCPEGPAIFDHTGKLMIAKDLDNMFHEILVELLEKERSLFPPTISTEEDIIDHYRCNRSFRRTSDRRELEEKVDPSDIDFVNKWDQASPYFRKKISQPMQHHYAEFEMLLKAFLRYTQAMYGLSGKI